MTIIDELTEAGEFAGAAAGPEGEPPRRTPRAPQPRRDAKDHKRTRRRAMSIHAYVGPNGSGKSAAMVFDTLPTLDGMRWRCSQPEHRHMRDDYVDPLTGEIGPTTTGLRRVLSTVPITNPETGYLHELYDELSSRMGGWRLVLEAEHTDILFDEISGIAGSRESLGMPTAVQTILQQMRKPDVIVRWTAPSYKRADSIIREITQAVTLCRGYLPDFRSARGSEEPRAWVPNRLFKWRTFDGKDFNEFTDALTLGDRKQGSKLQVIRPKFVAWVWGPGSRFFNAYDSFGAVSRVAEYLDGGRCAICGGRRSVPVCKCEH